MELSNMTSLDLENLIITSDGIIYLGSDDDLATGEILVPAGNGGPRIFSGGAMKVAEEILEEV